MTPDLSLMILLVLTGALAAAFLVWLLSARSRGQGADRFERMEQQMSGLMTAQTALTERLTLLAQQTAQSQQDLRKSMDERLDQVSQRMGHTLTESATKTAESLGKLATRLSVIDEAQKNITELSGQVIGLQDVLANKQARGAFGEVQLKDLVTAALPPSAYDFQVVLSNKNRADCLIRLPNPPGPIVVDAKFPLEGFYALRNAETDADKAAAARLFTSSITKHVEDIAKKYIVPGETAESAILFLPSEAVYAELHAHFGDLVQKSYRARVWIVSPTTLMATLNTIRAVMKDVRMREQAHVIQAEVARMMEDVVRLQGRVDKLQSHFRQATADIEQVKTSTDKILSRAEKIEEVQMDDDTNEKPRLDRPSAAENRDTPLLS